MGLSSDDRLLLHVGHLNPNRLDVDEILSLARKSQWKILIVGSTYTPQDPDVIKTLEDGGCIVLGDFIPRIEETYGAADAYLFPTRNPISSIGVPLSVLEALACGLPVVCPATEAGIEFVEEGATGFLLNQGDAVGLMNHLHRLVKDEVLRARLGSEARRRAQTATWDRTAALVLAAIENP